MDFILLFCVIIFIGLILTAPFNKEYPFSNTRKPFDEYDEDGYLTDESYRSHIWIKINGRGKGLSFGVPTDKLVKTRKFKELCESCKKIK